LSQKSIGRNSEVKIPNVLLTTLISVLFLTTAERIAPQGNSQKETRPKPKEAYNLNISVVIHDYEQEASIFFQVVILQSEAYKTHTN